MSFNVDKFKKAHTKAMKAAAASEAHQIDDKGVANPTPQGDAQNVSETITEASYKAKLLSHMKNYYKSTEGDTK